MSDLVNRAIQFSTEMHERIDHRRKYSGQPYAAHLEQVAGIVASVTEDPEMIAAAWLHDSVEDTPATFEDIERSFNPAIAQLVRELTDVSKPSDGNRSARKAIDRDHLGRASARGQTIKLADLIDNCRDITRHDTQFARIYLNEMEALLEVLTKADERLRRRARKAMEESRAHVIRAERKGSHQAARNEDLPSFDMGIHFKRQYNELFTAKDIAEPLLSFDADTTAPRAAMAMGELNRDVATVRVDGEVMGFVTRAQLDDTGACGTYIRYFARDQVLIGDAAFAEVIHVLTRHDYCFISLLGQVQGVINRNDVNKPYMRMWLFGIITLFEMGMTQMIREHFAGTPWEERLTEARVEAARRLWNERRRLNQQCDLIDCLQLGDKGQLLISNPELFSRFGFTSKSAGKRVLKQFQSLRNNLAHSQDISTYDWAQIARMSMRMLEN